MDGEKRVYGASFCTYHTVHPDEATLFSNNNVEAASNTRMYIQPALFCGFRCVAALFRFLLAFSDREGVFSVCTMPAAQTFVTTCRRRSWSKGMDGCCRRD